jgi:hypothetical protein
MTSRRPRARACLPVVVLACALALAAGRAAAADRFALIVSGASGSPEHAAAHARRSEVIVRALMGPLGLPAKNVIVLKDGARDAADAATREQVTQAIGALLPRMKAADVFLVVLLGHGTDDGVDAKFNLVGPDLDADEWRTLLQPVPARLVFVNTTSASAAFLSRLTSPRRIVITATDTPAQQYDTVFAEYFGAAFTALEADLDKDGRVSIGEAFSFASVRVKRYYAERGQLATERPVLDDTGDGRGKEAGTAGPDGALASRTFLDAGPDVAASRDPALSDLLARRDALETALEELKRKKEFMPADDYTRELERLLVEHARLSRRIRTRS